MPHATAEIDSGEIPFEQLEDLRSRQELASLLQGAGVGLALFDDRFNLVVCNAQYRQLMGFRDEEACVGANIADLMMLSIGREAASAGGVKSMIELALARLRAGMSYSVRHITPDGVPAEISRRVIASGMIVETVTEHAEGATANPLEAVAMAARTMMVHALDVMADGFALFDQDDRLAVYNQRFVDFHDAVADLVQPGVSFKELLFEMNRRGAYAVGDLPIESFIERRMMRQQGVLDPVEMQRADGRWMQISVRGMNDGCVVMLVSDITRIKQRELDLIALSSQLHKRNAQFDAALNNMAQGLCLFDADMKLVVANRRYVEMHGYDAGVVKPGITRSDIIQHSVELGQRTMAEGAAAAATIADAADRQKPFSMRLRFTNGQVVEVMSEPMKDGGAVATYTDVTAEDRQAVQLQEHALKLERSNRDLEEFAYVASHDLQEPLRKIEAFGDRLAKRYGGTLPEDGQMYVERMQNAAGRMRRLINDLLDYSRVMTKTKPREQIALADVLADVLGDLQVRIDEVGATVTVGQLPKLNADPVQMGQLFQNLLSNALKFVKPGVPPVITITSDSSVTDAHVIQITDNGIGFDNKYKDQIFKIFQRLHGRLDYEGTGVGLATVRKIVERHHGSIDCDGQPGIGARFSLRLPLARSGPEVEDAVSVTAALRRA